MPMNYLKEMFCDRVAASKIYQGKNYTDNHPIEYFMGGKDFRVIHPETSDLIELWLRTLSEKGEEETNKNRLGNLLSSITWSCNGGVTPFNRNQLHMYDLIDGINRTDKLLHYKNTMTGYYSGCIEKKSINFNELHWST